MNPPILTDKQVLASIRESWETVRILEARIASTLSNQLFSLVPVATGFKEVPDSLLLLFALATLEDALHQFRKEGAFSSSRRELKHLMEASRSALPWQNFAKIDEARERRNGVAHRREFLASHECKPYLDAIETELLAWGVLAHRVRGRFGISMLPNDPQ